MTSRTLMRVDSLAAYLGQSTAWCRQALADGTIPGGRKVGKRWAVLQEDVDAWLDAGRPDRSVDPNLKPYQPYPRRMTTTRPGGVA